MRKIFFMLLVSLLAAACTYDLKTNNQIVEAISQKGHAKSVTITDGAEATASFSGSKKEIRVDMGDSSSTTKAYILSIAYHCADTAYRITVANKAKMPDLFRVVVKSGGLTSDAFNYKSAYLAKDRQIWKSIQPFMNDIIAKQYDKLSNDVVKNLNVKPVVQLLQKADSAGHGVQSYRALALRQVNDEIPSTAKKIDIVQTWIVISVNGKYYPMMLAVGAQDLGIYGVFINPKN